MKKIYLLIFIIPNIIFAQTVATSLQVQDTRAINSPPSGYQNEIRAEFKQRDVLGVPGEGMHSGNLTFAPWSDSSGGKNHQLNFNDGGIFYRNGWSGVAWESWKTIWHSGNLNNTNSNFSTKNLLVNGDLHINANGSIPVISGDGGYIPAGLRFVDESYNQAGQVKEWAIFKGNTWQKGLAFMRYDAVNRCAGGICDTPFVLHDDGNISLGVSQKKIYVHAIMDIYSNVKVDAKLEAKEVKVTTTPTADFVFAEDYNLPKLEEVEKHIKDKKHLPEIASAKEMEKEGVNIGEFQIKLLQKIEELTLYTIEQNKQNKEQQEQIKTLQSENKDLKSLLERVEKLEKSSKN